MNSTPLIPIALLFYSCGLFAYLAGRRFPLSWGCMAAGTLINVLAVGIRYWQAWPMLPMHLMPSALPFLRSKTIWAHLFLLFTLTLLLHGCSEENPENQSSFLQIGEFTVKQVTHDLTIVRDGAERCPPKRLSA